MINATIKATVKPVFLAHYKNNANCMGQYYPEDDWSEDIFTDTLDSIKVKVAKRKARNDGSFDFYETEIVTFLYNGKNYFFNLGEIDGAKRLDSTIIFSDPLFNTILEHERFKAREEAELKKKQEKAKYIEKKLKARKELYEDLKREFES